MVEKLASSEDFSQDISSLTANGLGDSLFRQWVMVKQAQKRPQRAPVPLFLLQWIKALHYKNVDVANAVGITESYLSELANTKKDNPSLSILVDILDFLELTLDDIRRPPPRPEAAHAVRGLSPSVLTRLHTPAPPKGKKPTKPKPTKPTK